MKYFLGITNIDQAKLHYRKLTKQLHPDAGGTAIEFQNMQDEYKAILVRLRQQHKSVTTPQQASPESELLNELGKLAKVLIKKQVPQNYLQQKMKITTSPLKKSLFRSLVDILNGL